MGRAWGWRRRIERSEATLRADLAVDEGFSGRCVSRIIRLAWHSPKVLGPLVLQREHTVLTFKDLCGVAKSPWADQLGQVFD